MDRLNFRKKMAVFISFAMILQVVIGNVGYAADGDYVVNFTGTINNNVSEHMFTYAVGDKSVTVTVEGGTWGDNSVTVSASEMSSVKFKLSSN